jgi:8-oxo-dGTP diphosphatase
MAKHLYLFTLEVAPLKVGNVYDELPLHCTLMHRFWSELSVEELATKVGSLFAETTSLPLIVRERTMLGPKQVSVSLLKPSDELEILNMQLFELLNGLQVEYTAPQWVGKGHVFHVTDHEDERLELGSTHTSKAAYLIEVVDNQRIVRKKFELKRRFDATEYWPDTESEVRFIPSNIVPIDLPKTAAVIYAFKSDELLIIKNQRGWDIPGGHIEPGETPEQAIARELTEEAAARVEHIQLAGYLHVTKLKDNQRNKAYPTVGCIVVYRGEGIHLNEYNQQFETTDRMMLPVEQLPQYHHKWSGMKREIVEYVRGL